MTLQIQLTDNNNRVVAEGNVAGRVSGGEGDRVCPHWKLRARLQAENLYNGNVVIVVVSSNQRSPACRSGRTITSCRHCNVKWTVFEVGGSKVYST